MKRVCPRCHYTAKAKCTFRRHLERKKPCKIMYENVSIAEIYEQFKMKRRIKGEKKCKFCDREFTRSSHLKRHLKTCKVKNGRDCTSEEKVKILEERMANMEKELNKYKKKAEMSNTTNNINNIDNSNSNNTVINVHICSFGAENLDDIQPGVWAELLKRPFAFPEKFAALVHCNKKHPERYNISIQNVNKNEALVVENNKIVIRDRKKSMEKVLDNSIDKMDEQLKNPETLNKLKERHVTRAENMKKQAKEDKKLRKELGMKIDRVIRHRTRLGKVNQVLQI